jgi:chromosomal replication initiation ATPase DnaA
MTNIVKQINLEENTHPSIFIVTKNSLVALEILQKALNSLKHKKGLYLQANNFNINSRKEEYLSYDILFIDKIEFLKANEEEEFLSLLEELRREGKTVVFAATTEPQELNMFSESLRNILGFGLVISIS